jgi:O-antigen/teichoic acid export membrane protein
MINPIFTRVGFPLIASIQHDQQRVKQVYLKTMNMTAMVNAPIYVAMGVFAPEIVLLLLGEKWLDAAPLLRVLAIWGLFRSFGNPAGSLLFGLGRVRLAAKWNAGLLLIVPPVIWLGSQWGAIGMAWAMAGLMLVLFVPGWAILIRPTCGDGLWEYTRQVLLPTICALIAGMIAWLVANNLEVEWQRLMVGLTIGTLIYTLLSWMLNRPAIEMAANLLRHKAAGV